MTDILDESVSSLSLVGNLANSNIHGDKQKPFITCIVIYRS